MEITLGFENIEEIIFKNKDLYKHLDHYKEIFIDYKIGIINPTFKPLMKSAVTRLCMALNENDLKIIENVLNCKVNFSMEFKKRFIHINSCLNNLENDLPEAYNFVDISAFRDEDNIKVTIWK
jgi:hypothetical protein